MPLTTKWGESPTLPTASDLRGNNLKSQGIQILQTEVFVIIVEIQMTNIIRYILREKTLSKNCLKLHSL